MKQWRRLGVSIAAVALVAAACGDTSSPAESAGSTTTARPLVTTTTEPPAVPLPDDPVLLGDPALEALCVTFALAIGAADDEQFHSLGAALAAAIGSSDAGTPQQRRAATELLRRGLSDEGTADDVTEAVSVLAEDLGVESCFEVLVAIGIERPVVDSVEVLATLGEARDLWSGSGYPGTDYTLVLFVENSAWFEGSGGIDADVPPCGLFGELVVLVSAGKPAEVRDKFSGCVADLNHPLWEGVPVTVIDTFDFIEANAESVVVEFDPEFGAARSVNVDTDGGFLSLFLQEISEGHPAGPDEVSAAVAAQRTLWETWEIVDYRITVRRSCFCPPEYTDPYTVTVRSGVVAFVERDGGAIELAEFMPGTVEDLFAEIEAAAFADRLDVEYHPDLGYPLRIDIDPVFNAVDEELQIAVEELIED
jgi:hypothetical protein